MRRFFLIFIVILIYFFSQKNIKLNGEKYQREHLEIEMNNDIFLNITESNKEKITYNFINSENDFVNIKNNNLEIIIKNYDFLSKSKLIVSSIDKKEIKDFLLSKYKYINLSINTDGLIYISLEDFNNQKEKYLFDHFLNKYEKKHLIYLEIENKIKLDINENSIFKFNLPTNLNENEIYDKNFFQDIIIKYLLLPNNTNLKLNKENDLNEYINVYDYLNKPFKNDFKDGYISFTNNNKKYYVLINNTKDQPKMELKKIFFKIGYTNSDLLIYEIKKNIILKNVEFKDLKINLLEFEKNYGINDAILEIKIKETNIIFNFGIKIELIDNIKPIITGKNYYILLENDIFEEKIIEKLSAFDNLDKNISHNIKLKNKSFIKEENAYYLSFTVKDKANNFSDDFIVKIKLIDKKYPIIKVNENKIFLKENIKFNKNIILNFINELENKNLKINKISKDNNRFVLLLKDSNEKILVYEVIENITNNKFINGNDYKKNNKFLTKFAISSYIYLGISFLIMMILVILVKYKKKK